MGVVGKDRFGDRSLLHSIECWFTRASADLQPVRSYNRSMDAVQTPRKYRALYGYAAAVVGRLRSLPMTFLGAMILGVANSMAIGYSPQSVVNDVDAALPMAMLFLVLLFIPEVRLAIGRVGRGRAEAGDQVLPDGVFAVAACRVSAGAVSARHVPVSHSAVLYTRFSAAPCPRRSPRLFVNDD